jgi:Berberine and berberine like
MITPAVGIIRLDGRAVSLTGQQLNEVATRIEGSVLRPGHPGWNAAVLTWNAMVRRIQPFSTGGNYINFQTADEDTDRIRATYSANYDRLVNLKRRYDPDNLFRVNRNIPPATRPATARPGGAP